MTGKTPFEIVYGKAPKWRIEDYVTQSPDGDKSTSDIESVWEETKAMMEYYQEETGPPKESHEVGDLVYIYTGNFRTKRLIKKLDDKKTGPL